MAIIYADQVSEMAIRATYAGRPVVNVLHFYNDEGAKTDEVMARDVLDNWQDHIMGRVVQDYALIDAVWRSLDRNDTNQGTITPDPAKPLSGGIADAGAPPNVAYLVKKITNNRQRGQRDGRMFLAGPPEGGIGADGTVQAQYATDTNAALALFLDGVNDDGFGVGGGSGLVVLNTTPASRLPGTNEVDLTYRTVGDLVLDPKVSTQRDRLR